MLPTLERTLRATLLHLAAQFPAVIVTGPRQSGKTTLCRMTWPNLPYVNLERPDLRRFAAEDPRSFLASHPGGAILDEIQRVPELPSWLQVEIDEHPVPGRWVLTGSEQLTLTGRTSQSLAGRASAVNLLPLDIQELDRGSALPVAQTGSSWLTAARRGGYPAPLTGRVELDPWLASYVQSFLERDVRDLLSVGDLASFQTFVGLAAAWSSQLVNLSRLGGDAGVTQPTARSWLGVLEATFLLFRLRPWHRNLGKRLTKTPKLIFWDSGLLCHLLHIRTDQQLAQHPLRGAIFESWVTAEVHKLLLHTGERPEVYFYRDQAGLEVDVLVRRSDHWLAIEIKSGSTVASDFFDGLRAFAARASGGLDGLPLRQAVVYGGDEPQRRGEIEVVPWRALPQLLAGSISAGGQ